MTQAHASNGATASPLDRVLRRHGATMVVRDGRSVAAHFGSPTGETAVCVSTVGIADRSDRTTIELRGAPADIDAAIAALKPLAERAAWVRTGSRSVIVRCDRADTADCMAALLSADVAVDISDRFAAVEVIGPRAPELVRAMDLQEAGRGAIVLHSDAGSYELLVNAKAGAALWSQLLHAGAPLRVACVGLEALDHLAASRRLSRSASNTVR